jgi:hypothetical protein
VQPSKSEGWSTVVEDARGLGKRILLSDIDVHREQDPPRAGYFRPDDAKELAARLREVLEEQPGPNAASEAAGRALAQDLARESGRALLAVAKGTGRYSEPEQKRGAAS